MLDHVGPELQDALRAARQDRRLARERAMKRLQQARSRGEGQDLETKATKKAEAAKKKMEEGGKMKRQAKFTKIEKSLEA